jgi:formate transporter
MADQIDFYPPAVMAEKVTENGVKKAAGSAGKLFLLAILAGMFIATGGIFSTIVTAGAKDFLSFGITRLVGGLAFTTGLIMVLVAGSELFTGNILLIVACLQKRIGWAAMLRNWAIVYLGNFTGSILMAGLIVLARHYEMGTGAVGLNILSIGEAKTSLGFTQAVVLGVLCNFLVCLAVWMAFSARTTTDKILSIIPPIAAFVASGFEHSVANMYFIPVALLVKSSDNAPFFTVIKKLPVDFPHLTWPNFFIANLLPVTIGNIIGGLVLVGLVYWWVYLRKDA